MSDRNIKKFEDIPRFTYYYELFELEDFLKRSVDIFDIQNQWIKGYKLYDTSDFHIHMSLKDLDSIKEYDRSTMSRNTPEENEELYKSIKSKGYDFEKPMFVIVDKNKDRKPYVGEGNHRIMTLKKLGYPSSTKIPVVVKFFDTRNESINEVKRKKRKEYLDKKTPTVKELAEKYSVSKKEVVKRIKAGSKKELEHTSNIRIAKEIARDHLGEDFNYYKKLKKVEERYLRLLGNLIK